MYRWRRLRFWFYVYTLMVCTPYWCVHCVQVRFYIKEQSKNASCCSPLNKIFGTQFRPTGLLFRRMSFCIHTALDLHCRRPFAQVAALCARPRCTWRKLWLRSTVTSLKNGITRLWTHSLTRAIIPTYPLARHHINHHTHPNIHEPSHPPTCATTTTYPPSSSLKLHHTRHSTHSFTQATVTLVTDIPVTRKFHLG